MSNKAWRTDWNQIFESDENTFYCVNINRPMANAIISQLEYLRWMTRWDNAPSLDAINAFVDEIQQRLITPDAECADMVDCLNIADCMRLQ